jgi:membrane-associated protease RseP (regulator of RpoE activity)
VLTAVTTTLVGGSYYLGFRADFVSNAAVPETPWPAFLLNGLWYSLTVLAILGCHEMGHYLACRRYQVDASPPYFLPFFVPLPMPQFGTLGAFIRIRSRIPSKIALFDIGIAGPLAGFVVVVPALFIGLAASRVVPLPDNFEGFEFGEPLLFRLASRLIFGDLPAGHSVNLHPIGWAAWFGMLATALNLFPVNQLDGGHIAYAVLGKRSVWVTLTMLMVAIGLTVVSSSWIVWTVLLTLMLFLLGPHHPPTLNDHEPLTRGRLALAVAAVVMLALCFTPVPIEPLLTGRR